MEQLGITDSVVRTEGRLKTIFWPTIRYETDVDHFGRQAFWICFIIAVINLVASLFGGWFIAGIFDSLFYFLGGIGVRQRSLVAAVALFVAYLLTTVLLGFTSVLRIFCLALLLANIRGTWLSAKWRPLATEPPPVPLTETIWDKLSGTLPIYVWPAGRWVFYVLAVLVNLALLAVLLIPKSLYVK